MEDRIDTLRALAIRYGIYSVYPTNTNNDYDGDIEDLDISEEENED